jgi:acetyl-CoA synthetase
MGEWAWASGIAPLLGPWRLGAVQCVYRREAGFDPHKQLDFLSRHEVTNVFTTPTAMRAMMAIEDAGTRYSQKFRRVCSAGEPLNPEAIRWFREQYGVTVLDYYGLTESYPLVGNYPFMEVREGSMGKPMPGWDVEILDEDERPVAQGERGEICLRARTNPHYPLGYWNRLEDTDEVFGGEWFHTKDAAREDEDGYIWYEGRADDVIIAAGYRVGPFEVESVCLEHPAVREAAAVASPDELRGNVVKAFIVLAADNEPSDQLADEIKAFVRERLSAYAYPRRIEFVADLPKTLTGKIRRIELRQLELERAPLHLRDELANSLIDLLWRTTRAVDPHPQVHLDGGVEVSALQSGLLLGPAGPRLLRPIAARPARIHEHELLDPIRLRDCDLESDPAAQRASDERCSLEPDLVEELDEIACV